MKIYDRQGTPNAARIRIVLAEKGLDHLVEFATIDLVRAEQKADWFLALNPVGKTPLLVLDDGLVLSECTAITEYLDNLDDNPVLTGKTAREKGLVHMMQRRAEILLLEPVDDYFHYAIRALGPAVEPWRQPEWAGRTEWGQRRGAQAMDNLPWFESVLRESPFLAGERYSMADISLWAGLGFARAAGLEFPLGLTALAHWEARFEALPAVTERSGKDLLPQDLAPR
ncbi:MAG: glutathione S-transferase N-terminal domain-containing protein [Candidatus Andeanibacterium colombiense]|uniref:Glutathione S-transferase N-terminal domain-containing protein n=1 Tax=Candidatus Andeanibacterium colombiense TaxID=3121345 RepID=A0AAJ5X9G3_9SPHN|nr:MAG: glutathione S-transferase N-terminal domain-containing protein [Sphingomonadaceae bacterium]